VDYVPSGSISTTLERVRAFSEPGFIFEEKHDGIRAIAQVGGESNVVTGCRFEATGKSAEIVKKHAAYLRAIRFPFTAVLDGELMPDRRYLVFDCLSIAGEDLQRKPLEHRKSVLQSLAPQFPEFVELVAWSERVPDSFVEGVMVKDLRAKYGYGVWKAKRVETADVFVLSVDRDSESAVIFSGGKVSGVPDSIQVGDCIEVQFLCRFKSGKLRNGRFLRLRDDKHERRAWQSGFDRVSTSS
jgi:ATP-dependent DNA ligase